MTLESFAYLAEIVGVVGLIGSLLYVGKQVQLNREQLKRALSRLDAMPKRLRHNPQGFVLVDDPI